MVEEVVLDHHVGVWVARDGTMRIVPPYPEHVAAVDPRRRLVRRSLPVSVFVARCCGAPAQPSYHAAGLGKVLGRLRNACWLGGLPRTPYLGTSENVPSETVRKIGTSPESGPRRPLGEAQVASIGRLLAAKTHVREASGYFPNSFSAHSGDLPENRRTQRKPRGDR
jgi:hypothetical protein